MSRVKFGQGSIRRQIVARQMHHSKNIYNSGVYFQRRWYGLYQLILHFTLNHLDELQGKVTRTDVEMLLSVASQQDRTRLLEFAALNKDMHEGRVMTPQEMLHLLETLENDAWFCSRIHQEVDHQHMKEYMPQLKIVLAQAAKNRHATLSKKDEVDKSIHETPRLLPPSYLMWADLYVKHFIPSYKQIGSQVAQQTLKKVDKAYKSFFESVRENVESSKPPKYMKTDKFNLIYQKNSFKVDSGIVRLALGTSMKKEYKDVDGGGYLIFKVSPRVLKNKSITEIEIVPSRYENRDDTCTLILKYEIVLPKKGLNNEDLKKASIDLGIGNLATLYSVIFERPLIFDGRYVVGVNQRVNHCIDKHKTVINKSWGAHTSTYAQDKLSKRSLMIKDYFESVSRVIINICAQHGITELIIGYNKNWKTNVNLGRTINRRFYEIPYRQFVNMLFYKGEQEGIMVVENEEAYTSKCDALALEDIGHHEEYSGKRIKRGLFSSSIGILLNADVNGAINIMRKFVYKTYSCMASVLDAVITNTPLSRLCNPLRITNNLLKSLLHRTTREVGGLA